MEVNIDRAETGRVLFWKDGGRGVIFSSQKCTDCPFLKKRKGRHNTDIFLAYSSFFLRGGGCKRLSTAWHDE